MDFIEYMMLEKDWIRNPWVNHLLKHAHLETPAQDHVQISLGYLQGGRLHSIPGHLWSVSLTVRKMVPDVQRSLLCFSVAHCLWSCHSAPLKSIWPHCLCAFPSGISSHWDSPLRLCSLSWTVPSLSVSPHMSLSLYVEPWTGHSTPAVAHQCWQRRRITSLNLLSMLCLWQTRIPLTFLAARTHWGLMFDLVFTRTLQVLFCQAYFQLSSPQHILVPWIALPQVQDCISPCWTSRGSCHPISPAWWGLSVWQHLPASPPALCHLRTCWGHNLPHH